MDIEQPSALSITSSQSNPMSLPLPHSDATAPGDRQHIHQLRPSQSLSEQPYDSEAAPLQNSSSGKLNEHPEAEPTVSPVAGPDSTDTDSIDSDHHEPLGTDGNNDHDNHDHDEKKSSAGDQQQGIPDVVARGSFSQIAGKYIPPPSSPPPPMKQQLQQNNEPPHVNLHMVSSGTGPLDDRMVQSQPLPEESKDANSPQHKRRRSLSHISEPDEKNGMRRSASAISLSMLSTSQYDEMMRRNTADDQARRLDCISREQQSILTSLQKEDVHWGKQEQRVHAMVERMRGGQRTCEELMEYLSRGSKSLQAFAEAVRNQGSFGTQETGTLRQASIAQDLLRNSIFEHFSEMKSRVFDDSIKQASILSRTMTERVQHMEQVGLRSRKNVASQRNVMAETWTSYEKAAHERDVAEKEGRPIETDPLLACRLYGRAMTEMSSAEKVYTRDMSKLFLEMRFDDGRRIDAVKTIVLDYLLAQKAVLEHTVKFTQSAIDAVKQIDREQDVKDFVMHADLLLHPRGNGSVAAEAATVFEVPPPHRDSSTLTRLHQQEITLEGNLRRQGKIFKSNWKSMYAVVSTSGFFHYFDDENSSAPSLTIKLDECEVDLAPAVDKLAFEIREPNASFFNFSGAPNRYPFRANTQEELLCWVAALRAHTNDGKANAAAVATSNGSLVSEDTKQDGHSAAIANTEAPLASTNDDGSCSNNSGTDSTENTSSDANNCLNSDSLQP
jgi:PH domain